MVATEGYRSDSDPLAEFIAERCLPDKAGNEKATVLWEVYCSWAERSGISPRKSA